MRRNIPCVRIFPTWILLKPKLVEICQVREYFSFESVQKPFQVFPSSYFSSWIISNNIINTVIKHYDTIKLLEVSNISEGIVKRWIFCVNLQQFLHFLIFLFWRTDKVQVCLVGFQLNLNIPKGNRKVHEVLIMILLTVSTKKRQFIHEPSRFMTRWYIQGD